MENEINYVLPTAETTANKTELLDIQELIQLKKLELEKKIEDLKIERRKLLLESKRIKKLENQVEYDEEKAIPDELLELAVKFPQITSRRELEVLYCMSKYLTIKLIAEVLFISEKTVKFHRTNIYKRLKCKNEKDVLKKLNTI